MALDGEALRGRLPDLLPDWLPAQRWFAGKGRPIAGYVVERVAVLREGDPGLFDTLVRVDYADGSAEHYQVLVGQRPRHVERLDHATIGSADDGWLYDGAHDAELTDALLRGIAAGETAGEVSFGRLDQETADQLDTSLTSRLMTAEQSNTSLIYGEAYILKLFRRISAGVNPDLEVTRALARVGSKSVPPPLGWLEWRLDGEPATLGLLQPFLRTATEGWALATTSVRDLYAEGDLHADEVGGDFAAEAERLGATTAGVHLDLTRALPTARSQPEYFTGLAEGMQRRLTAAVEVVPDLAAHADPVAAAYSAIAARTEPVQLQRIHGDLHLGQVLRTDSGWMLLDFEGEPVKSLAERRQLDTPLRDVAGMLRSFDYAARSLLFDHPREPHLAYRAREWAERNREAFCAGYVQAGGLDPQGQSDLLRACELDKAVYEVVYEARHRPSWVPIPMGSIARLVS